MSKYEEYVKSNDTPQTLCEQIEKLQELVENRGKFIDWVLEKYPDIAMEYTEFDK